MTESDFEELERLASSERSGDRLRAMEKISAKSGSRITLLISDARVIPLLINGLGDADRKVQRAAARGLRPWLAADPALLDSILRAYAGDTFDGSYSHAGLYDTQRSVIWLPRYAAVSGHAALLPDANTDRFFRFDFFVPGQGPGWIPDARASGHLIVYRVPEWSYSRQRLIEAHEERALTANAREQQRFADDVIAFYRRTALAYRVRVHIVAGGGGYQRSSDIDVEVIEPNADQG